MQINGEQIVLRDWQKQDLPVYLSWQKGKQKWKMLDAPYYHDVVQDEKNAVKKIDYTLEARFIKARIVDGKYYDSIGYGVLREEWNQLPL